MGAGNGIPNGQIPNNMRMVNMYGIGNCNYGNYGMNNCYNPYMINMGMMNNSFYKMNQQAMMGNMINNNFFQFGAQGGNSYISNRPILPKNFQAQCDPFFSNSQKVNLIFKSTGNFVVNMFVPIDAKMKDVFSAFIQKVGIGKKALGKYIYFLFNGSYINYNEEKKVYEIGIRSNYCTILVIDASNLLAG